MNYGNIAFILAQFWNMICLNFLFFQNGKLFLFESLLQTLQLQNTMSQVSSLESDESLQSLL